MSSIKFRTSNIVSFSNNSSAYILGKNGFATELGVIPVLVSEVFQSDSGSSIAFRIRGLNDLFDNNSNTHILNNNVYTGTKQISFDVLISDETDTSGVGEVGYITPYTSVTSNVETFYLSNNILTIKNTDAGDSDLFSKLETAPFYARLYQPLITTNFADKSVFVTGTMLQYVKDYNIFGISGSHSIDIVNNPEDKRFISVYLDGELQNQNAFDWDGLSNVSLILANNSSELKVRYKKYTVPTIELGDNISIAFNNVHSVIDTSYFQPSAKYNSFLTANSIFKVYLADNLRINATSYIATNISPNPFGTIGNVNVNNNTFTLDYNEKLYPGIFALANNAVYKLVKGSKYTPLALTDGKSIYGVPTGSVSIRAQNINSAGRKSAVATATTEVMGLTLPAVRNLTVEESLYYDTTQGVSARATIIFDHDNNKDILAYEISYKIEGESSDLTSFSTVQIPVNAVGPDGKLRYVVNNVDRGRSSGVNSLIIRVTPINNDLTGITKQYIHSILGKTIPPDNVRNFIYAQNGSLLTLFWDYALNADNTLKDIDLQEVEIRRYSGAIETSEYLEKWNQATYIATVAIPSTTFSFVTDSFGTFTYLIKTRDTSRIESESVVGFTVLLMRPANLSAYKTWSEDDPSANNSIAFLANENYSEYYFPSFSNSDNGGLFYAVDDPITPGVGPSTLTENANGTSSGFSVGINATDLYASASSFYQTAIRDVGTEVQGRITLEINTYSVLSSTWLSMRENIVSGVSDVVANVGLLHDAGSYIGHLLTSNGAIWSTENKTLISPDPYGNVYAIWNSGQFTNDVSNANSFALIAGVVNANAIILASTYLAGAIPSGSNALPNLTNKASSYQLVNLKQWGDPEGLGTWTGPDSLISYNVQIRYSTDNVYYSGSNANVNVFSFTSSNTGSYNTLTTGDLTFRWFQLRLNLQNQNPALASAALDKFRYTVDLTDKNYSAVVLVNTNPTIVQFPQVGFKSTPIVNLTPIVDSPIRVNNTFPSYSSINSNATQANITVYDSTGNFVPNVSVNIQLKGF